MNCEHARTLLLEAEPSELRNVRDSALAAHLATCAECAQSTAAILRDMDALHSALVTLATSATPSAPLGRRRPWRRAAVLVPVAAAAAIAVLLVRSPDSPSPRAVPEIQVPRTTVVNGSAGRDVAVMQTRNPDITVVWNF